MKGAATRRLNVLSVRCLSPSEVLHKEIHRLTDCFVSCSSGGYIKNILFLVCKGGGWGGGRGVAKTSLYSFSVRLNGYISTLSVVFQQQQINNGVLNYLPSE